MNALIRKLQRAHRSLTVWVNAILITALEVANYAKDTVPTLKNYLVPDTYNSIMLAILVVNIALRFKTTTALEHK
jgi:hypothetical protein